MAPVAPPPAPGGKIVIPAKGSATPKTYVWMTDAKGHLVKVLASTAKSSFATLSEAQQTALAQQLIATNVTPTLTSLKSLWNKVVDGAIAEFKSGKQSTP